MEITSPKRHEWARTSTFIDWLYESLYDAARQTVQGWQAISFLEQAFQNFELETMQASRLGDPTG